MKNIRLKHLAAAITLLPVTGISAQQIISLDNELKEARSQTELVKMELFNTIDVFESSKTGSLKSIIEKSKGQGCLYMTNVIIKGRINFADLHFLAALPAIEKLNLYDAEIIGDQLRSNDIYPSDVYEGIKSMLKEIILPKDLSGIDRMAFKNLLNLKKITIPAGCRIIGEEAFSNTISLNAISLPENLLVIEDRAFAGSGLEVLSLPQNIKSIGRAAFQKSKLKYFSSKKVKECFFMSDRLLADCENLEYVGFHEKVRVLGKKALYNTPNLKEVSFASPLPPYLLDKSIRHLRQDVILQVPEHSIRFYKKKSIWRRYKKNYIADNQQKLDIEAYYQEKLIALNSEDIVTKYEISKPKIENEIQEIDVIKELGFDNSEAKLTKNDVEKSNLVSDVSQKESISPVVTPQKIKQQEKAEVIIEKTVQQNSQEHVQTVSMISKIENTDSIEAFIPIVTHEEKIEEIEIDDILSPTPAKVYWLSGKLYVEASRTIKVANLMTLDGTYIYGKAEDDKVWSFRIDFSNVASVRVKYVDYDTTETIKVH